MFDYDLDFKTLDFRSTPELYRIGKGEQGVLLVQPYKGEILPHWRFKTVAEAKKSSATIYKMFLAYLKANDFPGADMARNSSRWAGARRAVRQPQGRTQVRPETGRPLPVRGRRERGGGGDLLRATSPPAAAPNTFGSRRNTRRSSRGWLNRKRPGSRGRFFLP